MFLLLLATSGECLVHVTGRRPAVVTRAGRTFPSLQAARLACLKDTADSMLIHPYVGEACSGEVLAMRALSRWLRTRFCANVNRLDVTQ